jgi:hypothetical protein
MKAMTEADWATCTDPAQMLHYLRGKTTLRKLHLFVAACHRLNSEFNDELYQALTEMEERYAGGLT